MLELAIALSGRLLVKVFPEKRPAVVKALPPAPLGSLMRPVRARNADGRARYLARLRGPDGSVPTCRQLPVVGLGVYDDFVELYELTCVGVTVMVYMDRVHGLHADADPLPGFTMIEDS